LEEGVSTYPKGTLGEASQPGRPVMSTYVQKLPTWAKSKNPNATRAHLIRERFRYNIWRKGGWNTRWYCNSVCTTEIEILLSEPATAEVCTNCVIKFQDEAPPKDYGCCGHCVVEHKSRHSDPCNVEGCTEGTR
jgi:hypothetical protein